MAEGLSMEAFRGAVVRSCFPRMAFENECDILTPGAQIRLRQAIREAMAAAFIAGVGYGHGSAKTDEPK